VIVTVVATEEEEEPELESPSPLGTFELKRFARRMAELRLGGALFRESSCPITW